MKPQTMDRKTFLKWLGAMLAGVWSGRGLRDTPAVGNTRRPLKEARHYRTSRELAG